jgi:ribose transport system substrate-binding protein
MTTTSLKAIGIVAVFLGASVLLSLPGCKGGDKDSPKDDSTKDLYGFITNNKYDFWLMAKQGTEEAAKNLGVEVKFRYGDGTPQQQQQLIEDFLNEGVKGIAISPNDAKNMEAFFKDKVKVPLITQDSDVPDPAARRCYIGTHNYRAGRVAGKLVTEAAPMGGKIVIFVGKLDVQNAVERRQGVLDYLRDHHAGKKVNEDKVEMADIDDPTATNLKVGKYVMVKTQTDDVKREVCQQRAEELLNNHDDLVCLIGLWEYNPPAMLQAIKGRNNPPAIVGFDENYETLDAIKTKNLHATVVQNPFEFGKQGIEILHALAKGDDSILTKRKDIDKQNRIFIPHRVVVHDQSPMLKASNPYGALVPVLDVSTFYLEVKKNKGG